MKTYTADQLAIIDASKSRARRDDLDAVMILGAKQARGDGRPRYVFATAYGWVADRSKPPGGQTHFVMTPTGFTKVD